MHKMMKTFLLFTALLLVSWSNVMMPKQNTSSCILLCDESAEKMQACILNDSLCFLFTPDNSLFSVLDPSAIKRIKVKSTSDKISEEKLRKYCEKYVNRISGVFFVEMKKGFQIPASLLKKQKEASGEDKMH